MGIGLPELLIILVIVFLVFGAGKLPEVMGKLGQGVNAFKTGAAEAGKPAKASAAKSVAKKAAAKPSNKLAAKKPAKKKGRKA